MDYLTDSELGKATTYEEAYNPELLYIIPRKKNRETLSYPTDPLPFKGYDVWNAYELSWLNDKGKPEVALLEIIVPCDSTFLFESKSLKLYLNSFSMTQFPSHHQVYDVIKNDLSHATASQVKINLDRLSFYQQAMIEPLCGMCIDHLDIEVNCYQVTPELLTIDSTITEECVYSNLLRSNCPITGQPDWASIEISYAGPKIIHEALLQYLISYRQHAEFHENCVERIFLDLKNHCHPTRLTVHGRFTRRGGIDINPYRSTDDLMPENIRLARQ